MLLFDVLEMFKGTEFVFPVTWVVGDSGCPLDGVFEDDFEDAVGAASARGFVGECAWCSVAEAFGCREYIE